MTQVRLYLFFNYLTSTFVREFMDGSTQLTISAAVGILSSPSHKSLEAHVRAAWLAFRHFIPGIACKVSRPPSTDNGIAFCYTVPLSAEDSEKWLDETVFFSDEIKPLYEKHCDLKDKCWWLCSEDHYVAELHISPLGKCWQIRAVSAIKWGTEVVRLAPPGPFTMSLAERGVPPDLTLDVTPSKETKDLPMHPPAVTPWLYAPLETGRHGDVAHLVEFSREITARHHAVARRRGRTITQVVTALSVLAHAETSLKTAEGFGKERFKEVATMDVVRKLIKLNGANSVRRELDETVFWDMVQEVANAWQTFDVRFFFFFSYRIISLKYDLVSIDEQSLEGYFTRELTGHVAYQNFNPEIFYVPAIFVSSIRNLGRLGLLNSYLPHPREQALAVHDVVCGIRARAPVLIIMLYEYNGLSFPHRWGVHDEGSS
ncbi:hypothetical protein DFH11DRAFT_1539968 [Phellopilus nigrolimitatus]|nr:hypothetical protein DFH11DRAFT_1539968 [Phellopilus nigrolimitatus]